MSRPHQNMAYKFTPLLKQNFQYSKQVRKRKLVDNDRSIFGEMVENYQKKVFPVALIRELMRNHEDLNFAM